MTYFTAWLFSGTSIEILARVQIMRVLHKINSTQACLLDVDNIGRVGLRRICQDRRFRSSQSANKQNYHAAGIGQIDWLQHLSAAYNAHRSLFAVGDSWVFIGRAKWTETQTRRTPAVFAKRWSCVLVVDGDLIGAKTPMYSYIMGSKHLQHKRSPLLHLDHDSLSSREKIYARLNS